MMSILPGIDRPSKGMRSSDPGIPPRSGDKLTGTVTRQAVSIAVGIWGGEEIVRCESQC